MITAHEAQQLSRSSEIQTTKELEKIEILIKTEAATGKTILFYNCPKLEAEKVIAKLDAAGFTCIETPIKTDEPTAQLKIMWA